jgi:hypothetical protein
VLGVSDSIVAGLYGILKATLVGLDCRRVTTVLETLAFIAGVALLL